jgi:hypothetical protein
MEQAILVAVARADLILCQIGSLPWDRIGIAVILLTIFGWVVKRL